MPASNARAGVGTNQESVRRHNLSTLLGHLHLAGQLSRSSLTTLMGLNRSTIADLVSEVEMLGLADQQAPDTRGRSMAGRPSVGVAATDRAYVLAVDVRVSGLMVARVGLGGVVLSEATGPSPTGHDPQATVDAVIGGVVVATIANGLGLLNQASYINFLVTGGVLLLAASVDAISRRRRSATGLG